MHRLLHLLGSAGADGIGDDHVGAQGNADEQVHHQADDGAVGPHGGHGGGALRGSGKVPHDGHIRGVEQLLQNGGGRHRQGKAGQFIPNGPVEHIQAGSSGFHGEIRLLSAEICSFLQFFSIILFFSDDNGKFHNF